MNLSTPSPSRGWLAFAVSILIGLVLTGCTSISKVRLEKGLSMEAFENMGPIDRQPITMAVVIPKEVSTAVVVQKRRDVQYTLDVGDALSSKLMQVLAYKYARVVLLPEEKAESPIPWGLKMRVELTESDLQLNTKAGWISYTVLSGGYIGLKATVVNRQGQVVWVGSARAEGHGESAAGGDQVPDIQGGMSEAIDKAVAQIANQMARSKALKKAIYETEH